MSSDNNTNHARALVSVIVPTYNSLATVAEALASIAAQNCNTEILVIDDGSTDGTVDTVRAVCPGASIQCQPNSGAAAARNRGLQAARGDFIAFLDADDVWFPGKLRAQLAAMEAHPSAGFSYTTWLVAERSPDEAELQRIALEEHWPAADEIDREGSGWLYAQLLLDVVVHTSTLLMRRDLARETGLFDETLRRGQDYEYWLRMAQLATGIKLKRPLSLYRQHADNATRKPQPRNYSYEIRVAAIRRWGIPEDSGITPAQVRALLAQSCRDFAWLHSRRGSARLALRHALLAVGKDPSSVANVWSSAKIAGRALFRAVSPRRD